MAIETVNARYEGFIFDGQNSRNYGVYVTDVEVFGAPVRNVEMIQIPGRNGAYALDNGFYENIQVTYKCAMGCESQADFNAGISAFRNMLASRIGYKRLEDEINTDEYRMACFHGGISVPTLNKDTATFDVVFDCKPQRFLKSGENPRTIGGDVTNTQTKSGSIVSIESNGADKVTSLVAQIDPVQAGSGDPSPTNVRPITGWTAANVSVTGANVWDEEWSAYSSNQIRSNNTIKIKPNTQYYLAAPVVVGLYFVDASGASVGAQYKRNAVFTTPTNAVGVNLITTDYGGNVYNNDISINYPSTDHDYHPYTGHTYPVSFGSAGTVYGGTVDVVTGVLTVDRVYKTVNDFNWTYNSANKLFWVAIPEMLRPCTLISSHYSQTMVSALADIPNYCMWNKSYGFSDKNLVVKDTRFTDASSFKTNMGGVAIVYELATPQTYNLTAQQVELLTGDNNVWADTGDTTITWGDDPNKLVNPTLYNAHPLLSFTSSGDGTIKINNNTISVTNQPIGDIVLANVAKLESGESVTWPDTSRYLTGDAIRIDSIPAVQTTVVMDSYSYANYTNYISDNMDYLSTTSTSRGMLVTHSIPTPPQYVAGTAKSDTYSATVINKVKHKTTGDIVDCTINISINIAYDGANNITATNTVTTSIGTATTAVTLNTITVNSTKQSLVGTAYVDLDIGEAYAIDRGAVVSINDSVSLGASLPALKSGVNIISKTGSVENLKVTPRWWQL